MATLPLHNPTVPHLALIPGGLRHGLMIRVKGHMPAFVERFLMNIQTGPALQPHDDINIHLSVRPREHAIVRNHMVNNTWGTEEKHGGMPIEPDHSFEILILAENDLFKVAINGTHFCKFTHRIPLNRAKYFYIKGDGISVQSITLEGDIPTAPPMAYVPPGGVSVFPPSFRPGHNPLQYPGHTSSGYPQFPANQPQYHAPGAFPSTVFLRREIKDEF